MILILIVHIKNLHKLPIAKLLRELDPGKASGPDGIPNRILKGTANEIAPFMTILFNNALATGTLPKDWTTANVTPIYKKGSRHDPANYRPVSLTVVCCKLMEHILCKHILDHLENHHILTDLQHGFRSGHSCESQLLITCHDVVSNYDKKLQTDILILDFSKAFDTVPHDRLLKKLEHMGVGGNINRWIKSFLTNRTQKVLVDGEVSNAVSVDSGVPQGSVLGPLLFLCHINDLPDWVSKGTQVRMFADDCLVYRQIKKQQDHIQLQNDLHALESWSEMWGMSFNPIKCYKMTVARGKTPSDWIYTLCHPLEQVDSNPYLGVQLSDDLKWGKHINKVTKKANSTLGFLRRNLKSCPQTLKETAYKSLIRSVLEYSSSVWDPHFKQDIKQLEAVQRRAARFVKHDYGSDSSVTEMLQDLGWQTLENRRREARLALLFKVVHGLVAIPHEGHIKKHRGRTRAKNSHKLQVFAPNTDTFKYSFFPRTVKDWNNLDNDTVNASTLDTFKQKINKVFD